MVSTFQLLSVQLGDTLLVSFENVNLILLAGEDLDLDFELRNDFS